MNHTVFFLPFLALSLGSAAAAQVAPAGVHVETDAQGRSAVVVSGYAAPATPTVLKAEVEPAWTSIGPFGGDVSDVAVKPGEESVVLAGLAPSSGFGGSMYRSTDAGGTWTQVPSLSNLSVYDIEFASDGTAYAGTLDGPFKSVDGGATWTALPLGIGLNDQVLEITLDPLLPARVWVGVADALGSQTKVVLRSDDGGATWTDVSPAGVGLGCAGIAVDPTDSNRVFACFQGGFGGGAVWRTLNGGTSWTQVSAGLPGNPMNDIAIDATRVLVAGGQLFGSQNVGLYQSTNDGATWTPVHDGTWPVLVAHDIEIDPADSARIYVASAGAGVYRSTDGGATWQVSYGGTGSLSVNEVSVAPSGGAPVYSGSSSAAIWKDSGAGFAPSSFGIGSLNTLSIAANPLDPDELAVAFQGLNDGGVYTSTDGGLIWSLEPLPGTRFNTVAFAPDGTLHANSDGPTTIAAEGVYRRVAGSWTSIGPDQGSAFESRLLPIRFSATDPNLIYTAGADFGGAGFEATIWRSTNLGATWTKVYEGPEPNETVQDLELLSFGGGGQLLAAAFQDTNAQTGGALYSTDGGLTWLPAAGLAAGAQGASLALDQHADPLAVYLADDDVGNGGLFKSTDGGATYVAQPMTEEVLRVVTDPLHHERLFITQRLSGQPKASISLDGATFSAFDAGLASGGTPTDLFLTTGTCQRLLLATNNGAYARVASCELEGDGASISIGAGGAQTLDLGAGIGTVGDDYWILGSVSGTSPGTTAFGVTLPLNFDFYLLYTITHPSTGLIANQTGVLDGFGEAQAVFTVPGGLVDPSLVGAVVNHAFVRYDSATFAVLGVSNAVGVELEL